MKKQIEQEPLGKLIGLSCRNYSKTLSRYLKQSGFDISHENAILIHWLSFNPGISQHQINDCIYRDKTAVARIMDSLEKKGLIYREIHESDRRIKKVFLTEKGLETDRKIHKIRTQVQALSTAGITEEELDICRKTLKKISVNLKNLKHNELKQRKNTG